MIFSGSKHSDEGDNVKPFFDVDDDADVVDVDGVVDMEVIESVDSLVVLLCVAAVD